MSDIAACLQALVVISKAAIVASAALHRSISSTWQVVWVYVEASTSP